MSGYLHRVWLGFEREQLFSSEDASICAKGTSGDEGVVRWASSGGGVKGAVDKGVAGVVVEVEKIGGVTNVFSSINGVKVSLG